MKLEFKNRSHGELRKYCGYQIWEKPKPTSVYAIGVDVAEGVGGDASVASVINCGTGLHVASYWSNAVDVDTYAAELFKLGTYYNKAFLCIESNNHGHAIIALLGGAVGSLAYHNLYRRISYDEYTQERSKKIGFKTSATTKPRLIENLKSALKTGEVITKDRLTIQELGSFVRDAKTGRLGAKGKAHDDRVMALALAWEQTRLLKDTLPSNTMNAPQMYYDPQTGFPIL